MKNLQFVDNKNVTTYIKPLYCKECLNGKQWYVFIDDDMYGYKKGDIVVEKTLSGELNYYPEFEFAAKWFNRQEKLERILK